MISGLPYRSAATVIQFVSALGPAVFTVLRDAFGGYGVVPGAASHSISPGGRARCCAVAPA
jgi:hypothetical protein